MGKVKYIFFDCMETLVDLTELPSEADYAKWAFEGSGAENNWPNFQSFLIDYDKSKHIIAMDLEKYAEYEIKRRFEHAVETNTNIKTQNKLEIIDQLNSKFWLTYKSKCFVSDEVKEVVHALSLRYKLAVVSNFKVENGIEELLEYCGIRDYFEFVVTSIKCGFRKPDPRIYEEAIKQSSCQKQEIIIIGDDFVNDYLYPRQIGLKAIYLKKGKKHFGENGHEFSEIENLVAALEVE